MTTKEPMVADSDKLPIGKAATALGIARTTLLEHTKAGYIKCGISRINGRKVYSGREVKRYWRVYG